MSNMSSLSTKSVLKYTLLPDIGGRLKTLLGAGFTDLALVMAVVLSTIGLLPRSHPYLQRSYYGRYGIHHVFAESAKNLKFNIKYIDQLIIFFALLAGIALLVVQFFIVLGMIGIQGAEAAGLPQNMAGFVVTQNPADDIAFRLLDMTFGIPNLFNSIEINAVYYNGFHQALHSMFIAYSMAMLVVAMIISIYFIGVVLLETAQTGTPFGKRYNQAWVPLRIIVAFGLLIPVGYGMNASQYIGLYAAKFGSGFATNSWLYFNNVIGTGTATTTTFMGDTTTLVARPQIPDLSHLQSYVSIVRGCAETYNRMPNGINVEGYVISADGNAPSPMPLAQTSFQQAQQVSGDSIQIRFGAQDVTNNDQKSNIRPYCGEIVIDIISSTEPGFIMMMQAYYNLIRSSIMPNPIGSGACGNPGNLTAASLDAANLGLESQIAFGASLNADNQQQAKQNVTAIQQRLKQDVLLNAYEEYYQTCLTQSIALLQQSATWGAGNLLRYGWGGAAIGVNRFASINGGLTTIAHNVPRLSEYPEVMEYVLDEKLAQNDNLTPDGDLYKPELEQGNPIQFSESYQEKYARGFHAVYRYWHDRGYRSDELATHSERATNAFIDAVNAILGTRGLLDMCQNANIHPLAQLTSLGKGMIEASIRNMGYSLASTAMGGLAAMISPHMGAAMQSASGFFGTVAMIGLMMGFILFYIMPFMPFIYFFFAVGGWIKGLFEAMVGLPLWAVGHLRIDGDALPGAGGTYGYFLIFEIFLRPFMIMMGFLASLTIFAAMVKVLNDIFHLVVVNAMQIDINSTAVQSGCNITGSTGLAQTGLGDFMRGSVDEIFFMILYVILVYMIGMTSFKLIDQLPNQIFRWMGQQIKAFNDDRDEPAQNLVRNVSVGGTAIGQKLQGAGQQLGKGGEAAIKGVQQMTKGDG